MLERRSTLSLTRIIAYSVLAYGLAIVLGSLAQDLRIHGRHHVLDLVASLPVLIGLSYSYLGVLLLRRKYNAWVVTVVLSTATAMLNLALVVTHPRVTAASVMLSWFHIFLPVLLLVLLVLCRSDFRVRSDLRSFRQALQISVLMLAVVFIYGTAGFLLLDDNDFHHELSIAAAMHETVDQFGLTTRPVVPHTRRAQLFLDSLSTASVAAIAYTAISFFQPIRVSLANQERQRHRAEVLLRRYPSDIDDYFKLWPHDKLYFFDKTGRAALAYHVTHGQALVVGDPFGDVAQFTTLLEVFLELCFVNDWSPAFIHTTNRYIALYERYDFRLQKLGEEAVLDLAVFQTATALGKYFRQIRSRFTKLGYSVEVLDPPFDPELLKRLRQISTEWLERPGRAERRLTMGYYDEAYVSSGSLAVMFDAHHQAQGFLNLVPTFELHTANYDMLRCSSGAPGNCNDYLLLEVIEALQARGTKQLNLGLTPLAGLDNNADEEATIVHNTLRFVYASGDRFYSFSGLRRFKAKYRPIWEDRYVAYWGGPAGFLRAMTALTRAMRVK